MDTKTLNDRIQSATDLDKDQIAKLYQALADVIAARCGNLDSVALPSFGTFEAKKRLERVTVHPQTGKRMLIPPKIMLTFKPSAILKKKVKE